MYRQLEGTSERVSRSVGKLIGLRDHAAQSWLYTRLEGIITGCQTCVIEKEISYSLTKLELGEESCI